MNELRVAIVGATGLVGQTFLSIMEEFQLPVTSLRLFASSKSEGKTIEFNGTPYPVETVKPGSFHNIDYALFSAGAEVSKSVAKQAVLEGAIVIDNSSAWRMDNTVPLVVPEVNISDAYGQQLIANPNCSTIQAVLPLHVLDQVYTIEQIDYHTYQAVSGSGQSGVEELHRTKNGKEPSYYPHNISKTVIPQIDVFESDGYTTEEHKMMNETKKILHRSDLLVSATCVRVPVEHGHGVSIRVKLTERPNLPELRDQLNSYPGITVLDDLENASYPTSVVAIGTNDVFVGRLRYDTIDPNTILLFTVADNIRKGAALNAVQIMMELMNHV